MDDLNHLVQLLLSSSIADAIVPLDNQGQEDELLLGQATDGMAMGSAAERDHNYAALNLSSPAEFDQLAQIIKSAFRQNKALPFAEHLTRFAQLKEEEIEILCEDHFTDFVQGVDNLLQVRGDATTLKGKIMLLNGAIQESGRHLLEKKRALVQAQKTLDNLDQAQTITQDSLQVLTRFNVIQQRLADGKYYACLRMMDDVEKQLAQLVNQDFTFARQLRNQLVMTRDTIREKTMSEYRDWLVGMRDLGPVVGRVAMQAAIERQRTAVQEIARWKDDSERDGLGLFKSLTKGSSRVLSSVQDLLESQPTTPRLQGKNQSSSVELVQNEENEVNLFQKPFHPSLLPPNTRSVPNFLPLYQVLLVHRSLGTLFPYFQQTYVSDRSAQLHLLLSAAPYKCETPQDMLALEDWICSVLGWFVIEHHVAHTTQVEFQDFRSSISLEKEWANSESAIRDVWENIVAKIENPEWILELKVWGCVGVQGVLENHLPPTALTSQLLPPLFGRYLDLLRNRATERIRDILENDSYQPVTVDTPEEWAYIRKSMAGVLDSSTKIEQVMGTGASIPDLKEFFHLEDVGGSVPNLPVRLPFTQGLPDLSLLILRFITAYHKFLDGITQQFGEYDELLLKALNTLLVRDVHHAILDRLKMENLGQTVQVWWNLAGLAGLCKTVWEDWLDRRHGVTATARFLDEAPDQSFGLKPGQSRHAVHLKQASETFEATQRQAEGRVFEIVKSKIDEFLELCDYDFMENGPRHGASLFLQDLLPWLQTTVNNSLVSLPRQIKWSVYFDSLDHLAQALFNIVLGASSMSFGFLDVWDGDLKFVEDFVVELEKDEGSLKGLNEALVEMRQTVDLLKSGAWEEYFNPQIRNRKYGRVNTAKVANLLEKLLPPDRERRAAMEPLVHMFRAQAEGEK